MRREEHRRDEAGKLSENGMKRMSITPATARVLDDGSLPSNAVYHPHVLEGSHVAVV